MRFLLLFSLSVCAFAAGSLNVTGVSNTQAILKLTTDQVGTCTVKVSTVNDFSGAYAPVNDVNTAYFTGADQCGRFGSVVLSDATYIVVGRRTAEFALDGITQISRALQALTKHYVQVTIGSDTYTTQFTTKNIPLGNTWNDPIQSDKTQAGLNAWPTFDWVTRGQKIIDPQTGMLFQRITLPSDFNCFQGGFNCFSTPQLGNFESVTSPAGWSTPTNTLVNDSSSASVSGTQTPQFLVENWSSLFNSSGCNGNCDSDHSTAGFSLNSIQLSVNAWCSNAGDNCPAVTSDNRSLQFCLTVDSVTCASNWVDLAVLGCSSACTSAPNIFTVGTTTPILNSWFSGNPTFDITNVLPRSGNVTCDGSTTVTYSSGQVFNVNWGSGSTITIAGTPYTISSVVSRGTLITTTNCSAGGAWTAKNFGVLMRKKTTSADTIFVQYVGVYYTTGGYPSWDDSGDETTNFNCSNTMVAGPGGELGHHCTVGHAGGGLLVWIGDTTGTVTIIGSQYIPSNSDPVDGWPNSNITGFSWDPNDGNSAYVVVTSNSSHSIVVKLTYNGDNRDTGPYYLSTTTLTKCGSPPCWNLSNITPVSTNKYIGQQLKDFSPAYTAWANAGLAAGVSLTAFSGGNLMLESTMINNSGNNFMCMYDVFSPATNSIIAVLPSWEYWPNRWATCHGPQNIDDPFWYKPASEGYIGNFSGAGTNGEGPYTALITSGAVSSSGQTCPGGIVDYRVPNPPSGNNCLQVTLNGSVCDPSPGPNEPADSGGVHCANHSAYFLQDLAPGDIVCIVNDPTTRDNTNVKGCGNSSVCTTNDPCVGGYGVEFFRVLSVSGNTYWLERGWFGALKSKTPFLAKNAGASVVTIPGTCSFLSTGNICNPAAVVWPYVTDPQGTLGLSIIDFKVLGSGHGYTRSSNQIGSVTGASPPITIDGLNNGSYNVRGPSNSIGDLVGLDNVFASNNPPFNRLAGSGQPNNTDGHPNPTTNGWSFGDMRPFLGDQSLISSLPASVSGSLYQWHSSAFTRLRQKFMPMFASAADKPLLDISGPSSVITNSSSDANKICISNAANECVSGSLKGDVFVNAPQSSYANSATVCPYMGSGTVALDLRGVCVGDNGSENQAMTETSWISPDVLGHNARVLSHVFGNYMFTAIFWNWKEIPGGHWAAVIAPWFQKQRSDVLLAKLLPRPNTDSVNRGSYEPFIYTVGSGTVGDTVMIRAGYMENEPAGSSSIHYYCNTRQEACDSTTDWPTTPYIYDITETQKPSACDNGCSVSFPGIPERVLYPEVVKQNGASIVTTVLPPVIVN